MPDPIIQKMKAEQAYGSIMSAGYADAAKSARANEMGRRLGLDPDILESITPDAMAEDKIQRRMEEAHRNSAYAQIMANPRLAKAGIDDDHLPQVASRVDDHKNLIDFGKIGRVGLVGGLQTRLLAGAGILASNFVSGISQLGQGIAGLGAAAGENLDPIANPVGYLAGAASRSIGQLLGRASDATALQTTSRNFNDISSGVSSLPGSLAALGVTAVTGSPVAGVTTLGAITGGQSYLTGRDAGLSPREATAYGLGDAVVESGTEYYGEKYLGRLFGIVPGGKGMVRDALHAMGAEVGGEQIATALQGYNRWYWIDSRKGQTFNDFLKTLPDQERSTLVATLTGFGLTVGVGHIAQRVVQPQIDRRAARGVDQIMEAAANSETRKSNPTDFREALNQLVGDTEASNIYVPVENIDKALGDTPVEEHPFWKQYADQIAEARQLGSDVTVPLDHAATELATEWDKYRDDVRTRPGGMSIREAKEKANPEELQQLAEQAGNVIHQTIRNSQLTRARQIVGNWAEQGGAQGQEASVTNRLIAHGLSSAYEREVTRSMDLGQQAPTMEDFAAGWMPQVVRMKQAQYEQGAGQQALEQVTARQPRETVVNIGLKIGEQVGLTPQEVIDELQGRGVDVLSHEVRSSATEPTVVAKLSRPLSPTEAEQVSTALRQDAIAQRVNGRGELYGPAAEEWGPFNPEFFLEPTPTELDKPPVDADGNITLQHFSPLEGLTQTDPTMWGSRGTHFFSRSERQYMSAAPARTYFGIATGEPGGYRLEFSGRNEYEAKIPAERLYNVAADKDGLREGLRGRAAEWEQKIKDAGYAGYWHKNPEIGLVAVVFEPVSLTPVERDDAQTFNQLVHIPGFSHIEPYLTDEEREGLRAQAKEKILNIVKNLPDAEEMAAVAVAGRAKKGWYASSAQAIVDVFGIKDAPRFAALLAALSPQTGVEQNLFNALRTWTIWNNAGRPTDRATIVQLMGEAVSGKKGSGSILPAWINNSVTALTAEDPGKIKLSGPKVDSFMQNLVGVTDEVTNDTWMANYAEIQQDRFKADNKGGKGPGYKAFNIVVRRAAQIATEKTGEDWTPSEIQEAVWSFARTLYLRRDVAGENRDMQTLLDAGEVTHEDIAATPDFAVLFQDGFFRTILSEGGYDVTAVKSGGRAAGLDERASVAEPEGTGFAADAFKRFLGEAATRLERVRQRRRADRQANEAQPELVFNQAISPQEEVFYSAAQRAVANASQEKASAQQWKALLTPGKTPGIKSEEIEWTGIHDWLDMQKGPIDKAALLQVLRDRGVQVSEVLLGGFPSTGLDYREVGEVSEVYDREGNVVATFSGYDEAIDYINSQNQLTQFKAWSSDPSNDTYRELLITLPLGQGNNPDRAPSTHWDTEGVVAHVRFMEKTDAEGKRVLFIEEVQSDWHQKGRDQGYAQGADQEKITAAERSLEEALAADEGARAKLYAEADKVKSFFLERAAAEAEKKGDPSILRLAQDVIANKEQENRYEWQRDRNAIWFIDNLGGNYGEQNNAPVGDQAIVEAFNAANLRRTEAGQAVHNARNVEGIPDAPFKSSWPALVMKRAIRWAADNGYDKIAWTTGEEQAQRYSLEAHIQNVTIGVEKDGYRVVTGNSRANDALITQGHGKAVSGPGILMSAEQIETVFGKDLGGRLIAAAKPDEMTTVEGADLRVGGEGMKAFYDRNLVNITNDIIKKYGAKVGQVEVGRSDSARRQLDAETAFLSRRGDAEGAAERESRKFSAHPGFEITPQLREAASGGFPLFQQKRGNISITPGANGLMQNALIRTFEDSNFSTLVHELGHFFLEDLRRRALSTGASDQERADWETFKAWAQDLGHDVQDDTPIPVDAHEYFARGFERFTWEGSAPSIGLRRLFFRLREFMLNLYKSATQFDAPITPEIREVMGRMLASDQEISEQRDRMNLVSGEIDKLMSEDERKAYNDLTEESRQDARDQLFTRVLSTMRQERMAEARDRKAQIRSEVQAAVDQQPIFRALKLLRVGMPQADGTFAKVKLDREQLIAAYGPDIEQQLPTANRIVSDKNGMDIDHIAALSGYESGDAMVRDLQAHEAQRREQQDGGDRRSVRAKTVDDQTDQRFRDEVGDPLKDLEEEAQAAIANDRQADLLTMELRAMGRRAGRKPTPWKLAKEWAAKRVRLSSSQEAITGRKIQEYARNVSKAGQQAEDALAKGDVAEAFAAKQRQMLNMALLSEAKRVKQDVEAAKARLSRISSRDTIPSVDQDYLEQAHQLLEDVSLKENPTQAAKRQAFEDWYLEQVAAGVEPTVPPRYRAQLGRTHWSKLTIDEFLELDRAVGQIVELGRLKKRLREGQRERDFDEGIAEMEAQAELQKERSKSKTTDAQRTLGGRVKSRLRGVDAAMIKMEQMIEWLDGDAKDGPWRRLLFNIIADAQVREKDLTHQYVGRLNAMIKALPKDMVKSLDRLVDTPELVIRNSGHSQAGMAFRGTKDQILVMAMNWGNEGNRQRLLDGFGWQAPEMQAVFDRLMTKQDWDFVQGVWDLVNDLWPEIEQLERRVNGLAPEKVENTEVQTQHGMYRGGYFPVVYDPNESTRAELDEASKLSPNGAWHQVTTRAGSTHGRVERVMNRPLLLNMGVITRHIGEVIHDVTHREAVVQVRKVLADNRIRTVVNSRLGPEYHRRMGSWLENIATPNMANSKSDPSAIAIARHLNKGISLVGLGFRFTTILVQPIGLSNSISEIGVARVAQGLRTFIAHPRQTYNEIVERSGEMRSRFSTMDASIEDMMNEAKAGKLSTIGPKTFVKYAFHGILYADMLVTTSSWIGAYNKALAEGESEEAAVSYADGVIRKTQGAGGQKDRSSIMYENQFARTFWPFFSYLNALYNQQRDVFHKGARVRSASDALEVARRGWWVFIVPTLLQSLMFGDGPPDDENNPQGWATWITKAILLGNMASLPGVGALAQAIGSGYGYRSNAWQGIGEDLKKSWEDIDKLGEDDSELKGSTVQKVISTAGILTARPLGQAAATSRGIYDYERGAAQPESASDWYQLLTKGRISQKPSAIQQLSHVGQEGQ